MKKILFTLLSCFLLVCCSNFTSEQAAAAKFVCDCIDKDEHDIGDPAILYQICFENQAKKEFDKSILEDEGFANALFANCPDKKLVTEK